ncbi:MAG TPA: fumarylacetoacetate hydrolase family protein [Armatimonadota bacterium]|nr:fumarylacetoacetate hydrolase family protein [Armatimonadota bacterium]
MILRLCEYELDDWGALGLLVDDEIYDLESAAEGAGVDITALLALEDAAWVLSDPELLQMARAALEAIEGEEPVEGARLISPVMPAKLFCLATNFMSHMQESISRSLQGGEQTRELETPRVFMKPPQNTLIGSGTPLRLSKHSQWVDYEAEMAIIIGDVISEVPVEEAKQHIIGVTCFNDISERELRIWDRKEAREWDRFFDWLNGKWADGFAPMGPCVVPVTDVGDPDNLDIILRLNGEVMQQANTSEMIFNCAEIVSYISHICTLVPGDVIACGTPAGVGKHRGIKLTDGDLLEVEIPEVGVLRTPVVGP